jgi:N-acetylglucosamine kinase-like BadF-type ATPase
MNQRIAVGVDAGGTSTVAALAVDGEYEGDARGGSANPSALGVTRAAAAIVETVKLALRGRSAHSLYVGAAGAGRASIARELEADLRAAFPDATDLVVADDARIALRAGIDDGPGIALIAGTGSVAYAENGETRVRVGGAGYLLGDEGSAFALGFGALKLLARVYDGRARADETTALAARALAVSDRDGLLDAIYRAPLEPARIAALAPSIVAFAGKGNRISTKLVQTAAQELGDLVRAAAQQSGLAEASPLIVFAGGLLCENSLLTYLLETRVVNEIPGSSIVRVRDEPARAALRLAIAALSSGSAAAHPAQTG